MARGATFGPMKQTGTLIVNDAPPRVIKAPAKLPVRKPRTQTQVKVENRSEDAMAIDEPSGRTTLHRVARKTTSGTLGRIPIVTEEVIPDIKAEEEDDEPAHKKRRTSSEGDVEATVETYEEPIPADAVAKVEPKEEEDEVLAEGPVLKTEKAEATGWEDLDRNDFDDPNMVSEYVNDIFEYLAECEVSYVFHLHFLSSYFLQIETLPNANYMSHQKELKWSHRTLLMDFLIAMQRQLRLLPETLHLAVNIIDRFLSLRVVSLSKLQLVGLACFMIATKFEEIAAPSVKHWLHAGMMIDDATEEEMLKAEKYILKTLNWNISTFPQPMNWIRRVSKADDYDAEVRLISKFFLDLHVIDRKLLGVKPSLIAAASMWCARVIMGKFGWVCWCLMLHLGVADLCSSRDLLSFTTPDIRRPRFSLSPTSC